MLNYIWAAMLIIGVGMALSIDFYNEQTEKFPNDKIFDCELIIDSTDLSQPLLKISADELKENFGEDFTRDEVFKFKNWNETNVNEFVLLISSGSSKIFKEMANASGDEDEIKFKIISDFSKSDSNQEIEIKFPKISFIKLREVTNAAIDYSKTAVTIALGLIGIMALWLGIMRIADKSGLIKIIASIVRPITKFLFPSVPSDHPAIGAIVMNISANMLGLGNAATPFGIKAMEELNKLNTTKDTATNAMCMFLAVNTAGLTLIPATAIAIRAAAGSNDPAIIIGTSIFGASCATLTGIFSAKFFERFSRKKEQVTTHSDKMNVKDFLIFFLILLIPALILAILFGAGNASENFKSIIQIAAVFAIPLIIILFVLYGMIKRIKVYEEFVEGAKEGFNVAVKIIPYLVAMLVAIGIFRAGSAMELLVIVLSPITNLIGMPAEVMPMALMRPLSGSGSIGLMTELMTIHGADSFIGVLSSTILGSTETTFYVLAVYFGAVNISKTRHALTVGLLADIAGILGALFIVKILFG
ncbi:MAG: spore maturation protein [Melioribacteraceae bacterium]|nr:spore maturation protein [Melioribacteraceae bacterium]